MLVPEYIKVMSNGKYRRWEHWYVVFVLFLIVLAVTLAVLGGEHAGEDYGGLFLVGAMVFWVVSFIFFIVNAAFAIAALIRGRSAAKPLIGCALPILCIAYPIYSTMHW